MTTEELSQNIWKKQNNLPTIESDYWKNISFTIESIENCCNKFVSERNLAIAAGYGKLLIMELWTLRELFICLKISTTELDNLIPNLKEFRDAYAHIKERIEGFEMPFNKPKTSLNLVHKTLANGALVSTDGKNWKIVNGFSRMFNLKMDGNSGVLVIFGIINNYLICNSSSYLLELEITPALSAQINDVVNNACA